MTAFRIFINIFFLKKLKIDNTFTLHVKIMGYKTNTTFSFLTSIQYNNRSILPGSNFFIQSLKTQFNENTLQQVYEHIGI